MNLAATKFNELFKNILRSVGAFVARYLLWTPILLCAFYFNDPWKYLGWFFAVIIGIDLIASLLALIPKIRKSHAMGVLWIIVISSFYLHTSWHSDPNSEMGSFKPEVTSEARGYYDLLAANLAKGQLDLGIYCNDMNWCPDPYDINKRKFGWYLVDTSYYNEKYYIYFGITPVLTLILPFYLITGKFLPSPITIWIFCTLAFVFAVGIIHSLIRISRLDSAVPLSSKIPDEVSENFIHITFLSLGMGGFVPFILNKPHIYEIAQSSGLAFSLIGIYFLLLGWIKSKSSISYIWFSVSGLSLALAVGARPTCIFCGLITAIVFGQLFLQKKLRILHLASFLIPYGLYGAMLACYNYLRFDSFTEFGYKYLLNDYIVSTTLSKYLFGIRNFLIMPPHFHEEYPYITLLWDWRLPVDVKSVFDYIAAPTLGAFWICPLVVFSVFSFFKKTNSKSVKLVNLSLLAVFAVMILTVTMISEDARYSVDFMYYLLIPAIFSLFVICNKKIFSALIVNAITFLSLIGISYSTAVSYFASRPTNALFKGDEGTREDKIAHFEKYKEVFPEHCSTYFVLGAFYSEKGDYDNALLNFIQCQKIDPSFHEVQDRINKVLETRKQLGLDLGIDTPFSTGKYK
jgi:hypothetical protein